MLYEQWRLILHSGSEKETIPDVQKDVVTLVESTKHNANVSFVSNGVLFGKMFPQGISGVPWIFSK